jgi:hypothetical protein
MNKYMLLVNRVLAALVVLGSVMAISALEASLQLRWGQQRKKFNGKCRAMN